MEDKALPRRTRSAATVQWHGNAADMERRFMPSCFWRKAENLRGPGTASPVVDCVLYPRSTQEPEEREVALSRPSLRLCASASLRETQSSQRPGRVLAGAMATAGLAPLSPGRITPATLARTVACRSVLGNTRPVGREYLHGGKYRAPSIRLAPRNRVTPNRSAKVPQQNPATVLTTISSGHRIKRSEMRVPWERIGSVHLELFFPVTFLDMARTPK